MYLIAELSVSFAVGFLIGVVFLYGLAALSKLFGKDTDSDDDKLRKRGENNGIS